MDYEEKEEHFILEEYDIGSNAEIQLKLLRKYEKFRSTEVEVSDDISSVELLKMENDTQQESTIKNDTLTVDNENNMRTSQPKKALYLCQHCNKRYKKELAFASIYQNIQLLMRKHHQKMKARQACSLIILIKALFPPSICLFVMDRVYFILCPLMQFLKAGLEIWA